MTKSIKEAESNNCRNEHMQLEYRTVIHLTDHHKYIVESVSFHASDGETIGDIHLLNQCTNQSASFSIWIGDDDLSNFYVCLPTGDVEAGEDELEVYDLDVFDIPISFYENIVWQVEAAGAPVKESVKL